MGFLALKDLQAAGDLAGGPPWRQDSHFVVLFWLAKYQGDRDGWSWPSFDTLARLGRKSRRQVIRIIQQLEDDHLIEVSRHGYRNRYRLTLPTRALQHGVTRVTKHSDAGVTSSRDMVTSTTPMVTSAPNMVTPWAADGDTAVSPELKGTVRTDEQRAAGARDPSTPDGLTIGVAPSPEQRHHLEVIRERLGLVRVG